jgi:MFS-type transporter involved in bile tolerance (Atg22 family)
VNQVTANKFCSECGNALIETAVICPKCGSPTVRFGQYVGSNGGGNPNNGMVYATQQKSKSVAVVLAVFLGFWTYLYTYKKDVGNFWASLAIQIFAFFVLIFIPDGTGPHPAWLIAVVINIVAIIVQASRTSAWFAAYPNN